MELGIPRSAKQIDEQWISHLLKKIKKTEDLVLSKFEIQQIPPGKPGFMSACKVTASHSSDSGKKEVLHWFVKLMPINQRMRKIAGPLFKRELIFISKLILSFL